MAQIEFIKLESYGTAAPVQLTLVTHRYEDRDDSQRTKATHPLGDVPTNTEMPIGAHYRYQRGISVGLVDSSHQAIGGVEMGQRTGDKQQKVPRILRKWRPLQGAISSSSGGAQL